ncbi:FkbM family methyltransferase [Roseimaritima ulvae]|uniref:31-O-demethyl-FK506 methyltransferase FkbM n=1 Tax=Roseimaritima ulvae TaxID=980254 RepID=A0A5B9QIX3_9BACT|nr:FkbM family methyltransferase [Roseimaritima ulvae]QEG38854.1 31-O-demethyl-FK506 methyltransferase FkbM [Roseimaritima ulvae]
MQKMKFRGYQLHYAHREAAESMVRQIDDFPSFFTPADDRPQIIDCGANIGVSVLEWKTRWPGAQILCFEPDPAAFQILQKNIDANDIPGVKCVQAAVSDQDQPAPFYGDLSPRGDARGNSLNPDWGDRAGSSHTTVTCRRLSTYLAAHDVDFLKLDIEGAEQRVLREAAEHLHRVRAMYVEVHETDASLDVNSTATIEQLLSDAGFTLEAESRYDPHALPAHLSDWQQTVGARQTQLLAWR